MDMAPDKRFLAALGGRAQRVPPVWLMRQAGRYLPEYRKVRAEANGFLDLCFTPDLAVEVTLQPIRRYGFDAAILFSDILVIPHGLGQGVAFKEGEGPVLDALPDPAAIDRLELAAVLDRLAPVMETVRRLSRDLPPETALIGFAGAPWTVATYMIEGGSSREFMKAKRWAYGDPQSFARLIDVLVAATSSYLIAQIEAGAEAVQIFDSWAGALPSPELRRWSLEPMRRIAEEVKAVHPAVPVIAFPRGAGEVYRDFVAVDAFDAVSLDTGIDMDWARETLQPQACVQGNLDPVHVLVGGDALRREVHRIKRAVGAGPFVFNLGHGILQWTPPEHVDVLLDALRSEES